MALKHPRRSGAQGYPVHGIEDMAMPIAIAMAAAWPWPRPGQGQVQATAYQARRAPFGPG